MNKATQLKHLNRSLENLKYEFKALVESEVLRLQEEVKNLDENKYYGNSIGQQAQHLSILSGRIKETDGVIRMIENNS